MPSLIAFRLDNDTHAFLEELALKHHTTKSEVIRRFISAGVDSNPLTEDERRKLRAKLRRTRQADLAGLVVPMHTDLTVVDSSVSESVEKKGIEPVSTAFGRILHVRRAA